MTELQHKWDVGQTLYAVNTRQKKINPCQVVGYSWQDGRLYYQVLIGFDANYSYRENELFDDFGDAIQLLTESVEGNNK